MLRVFLVLFFISFSSSIRGSKFLKKPSQFNIKLSSYQLHLQKENFKKKLSNLPSLQSYGDFCNEDKREETKENEEQFKKKRKEFFTQLKKIKESYLKEMDTFSHHFLKNLSHFLKNLNHSLKLYSLKSEDLKGKAPDLEKKIKELFKQDSYFSTSYNHLFYEYEKYFKVLMTYLMKNFGFYYEEESDILDKINKHYQFTRYFDSDTAYCLNDAVFNFAETSSYKNTDIMNISSMELYYETLYLEILGMEKLTDHFLKQSLNCISGSCVWTDLSKKTESANQNNSSVQEGFFLRLAYNLKSLAMGLSKISQTSDLAQNDLQEDLLKHIYTIESSLNASSLQFLENQFKITRIIFSKHLDESFQEYCEYQLLLEGEEVEKVCPFR